MGGFFLLNSDVVEKPEGNNGGEDGAIDYEDFVRQLRDSQSEAEDDDAAANEAFIKGESSQSDIQECSGMLA